MALFELIITCAGVILLAARFRGTYFRLWDSVGAAAYAALTPALEG